MDAFGLTWSAYSTMDAFGAGLFAYSTMLAADDGVANAAAATMPTASVAKIFVASLIEGLRSEVVTVSPDVKHVAGRPQRYVDRMSGDIMVGFGPKQAWLAIRDRTADEVIAALALRDLGPVTWRMGIDLAYTTEDRLAVTPPLPGANGHDWVLVPGLYWFHLELDPGVAALSDALHTEVQFFSTYRVTEQHRWERAVDGVLVRAFEYIGESGEVTLWWGDPDEHERAIGIPEEEPDDGALLLDESDVMRLAAAWSIDPLALDGQPAPDRVRTASKD